jgi:hypothetical protein
MQYISIRAAFFAAYYGYLRPVYKRHFCEMQTVLDKTGEINI